MPRCRVGLGAWGSKLDFVIGQGWPPSSTSISNCALLPLVPRQPTLGMDSPMLETEGQRGAGGAPAEKPRRVPCGAASLGGGGTAGRLRPHHRASGNGGCGVEGAVGMEME